MDGAIQELRFNCAYKPAPAPQFLPVVMAEGSEASSDRSELRRHHFSGSFARLFRSSRLCTEIRNEVVAARPPVSLLKQDFESLGVLALEAARERQRVFVRCE